MKSFFLHLTLFWFSFNTVLTIPSPERRTPPPDLLPPIFQRALPTGTCNANTPCENAACCGTNGLCGYSPTECGAATTRACQPVDPEDLNLNGFTHINFAFAFFDPKTFAIAPMDDTSGLLYERFTGLKDTHNGLETWISVGGWSFTDPGPTRSAFSDMSSNAANRKKFINELINFMEHYGFDGVDLDWEYPQADDRGGVTADKANYISLVKEMRAAFGDKYGITLTLPTSYWYLQHFDLESIQPNVNWFNFMAYDLHGVWDAQSQFVGPYIAPHTNVSEIDLGMDLLWRAGLKPENVVLGMGWYGRSFTLADPSCNTPNGVCKFTGGAKAGECSQASGILDLQEIKDIVWAMDQVDQSADNGLAPASGVTTQDQEDAGQMRDDLVAGVTCYSTDCGAKCKKGTNEVTQMNGQPGKLSTSGRCNKGEYRSLCCDDGTTMGTCKWRGFRGIGLSCMGGCADGETEVVQDTNNHGKSGDQTCTGGIQSYCCKGFKPAPSPDELKQKAEDEAKAAAEAAAEQAALDIAAKAFCRLAVPALLAPLEALEALIPIVGEILDIAEIAATPALIQLCTKGIEKEGKAIFKVFGKEHTIDNFSKPTAKKTDRPDESSHSTAKTKDDSCSGNGKRAPRACRVKEFVRTTAVSNANPARIGSIVCDVAIGGYSQPCLNYRSIASRYPQHRTLTCPYKYVDTKKRTAPRNFYNERNTGAWNAKMIAFPQGGCEYDEFPPAAIADLNDGYNLLNLEGNPPRPVPDRPAYGRYVDSGENQAAGKLFGKCLKNPKPTTDHTADVWIRDRSPQTKYIDVRAVFTRQQFTMDFPGLGDPEDDGLADNACQPYQQGVDHRGYALQNNDDWFLSHANAAAMQDEWASSPNYRREWVDSVGVVVVGTNSSRPATREETAHEFGFDECQDGKCSREIEALKIVATSVKKVTRTVPSAALVEPTPAVNAPGSCREEETTPSRNRLGLVEPDLPKQTVAAGLV
ncbi:hypothetical protein F4781DRAFT_424486 [Annulohypoxylon bovei var. microspora]|nr:hypothetical protein F4781DRAFT_424486 [Annulohypoxylon bovei var. microspora]